MNETPKTDENGYLIDFEHWDKSIAERFAADDGVVLTERHWQVIDFLRSFYSSYQTAPGMRMLLKALSAELGEEFSNSRVMYQLFPEGPAKQACRFAGLPKPVSCI